LFFQSEDSMESLQQVGIKDLRPSPFQHRTVFDEAKLQELADSIGSQGIIEPIIGRRVDGHIQIIAGERRFRAAKLAKLSTVPVLVRDMTDGQAIEAQLVENEQREDVDEIDQAAGFKRLMALDPKTYTVDYLATRLGLKPASVYLRLKLLELIPEAEKQLREGKLSAGHGVLIARLGESDQKKMLAWLKQKESWNQPASVRDLKAHIARNVKIDLFSPELAVEQPKVAERLAKLKEKGVEVLQLSRNYVEPAEAKKSGLLGSGSYREAGKKKCDNVKVGAFVLGAEEVQLVDVCTDTKCKVHFPELARQRAAERHTAKAKKESPAAKEKRLAAESAEKARREREARLEGVVLERIVLGTKKLERATLEALVISSLTNYGTAQHDVLVKKIGVNGVTYGPAAAKTFKGLSDKQIAQLAQFAVLMEQLDMGAGSVSEIAKQHGIDLKKLDAELAAAAEKKPAAKAAGKKPAGRKKR
jgi:ParB family chromosome partitioning protein